MRWIIRHAVFALCLTLGTSVWYILAQKKSTPVQPVVMEESPANQPTPQIEEAPQEDAPNQSITFGPVEPIPAYANTKIVTLRESPDANAKVVAKLETSDGELVLILGAKHNFLRVKFSANTGVEGRDDEQEGWTTWGSVVPDMSAIVLDTDTGEVVSRVPLSEGVSSVAFSPDGSRAIFSSGSNGAGRLAYEVRTSDYTMTRSLTSSTNDYFGTLFYGPTDGALYATVYGSQVNLLRITDGASNIVIPVEGDRHLDNISPDGLTGFDTHRINGASGLMVDVIDVASLKIRNTFKLTGDSVPSNASDFVFNRDGSELYVSLSGDNSIISVIDTRTGRHVREIVDSSAGGRSYFSQGDLIGDSLLLRVWDEDQDEMHTRAHRVWVSTGKRMLAEPGIEYVVEVGSRRYAVNDEGTLLFNLDGNNRIQHKQRIDRPERRKDADTGNALTVFGLKASPDGEQLIMFVGMEHGC